MTKPLIVRTGPPNPEYINKVSSPDLELRAVVKEVQTTLHVITETLSKLHGELIERTAAIDRAMDTLDG